MYISPAVSNFEIWAGFGPVEIDWNNFSIHTKKLHKMKLKNHFFLSQKFLKIYFLIFYRLRNIFNCVLLQDSTGLIYNEFGHTNSGVEQV